MKFKGIIPELKMSEGSNQLPYFIDILEHYPVVSVNTSSLFSGDISFVHLVRKKYPKKFIIRKDFIMIPAQIKESKEAGADAVLLIRNLLTDEQYSTLVYHCQLYNIKPITEVHNSIQQVLDSVILINSRNLNTGEITQDKAENLCEYYKRGGFNVIYASGEKSDRVVKKGIADAVLIGTSFMQGTIL